VVELSNTVATDNKALSSDCFSPSSSHGHHR